MSVLPTDIFTFGSLSMPGYDGSTTLSAAITTTTAATMTVTANASFPQSGEFAILVDSETMWVTQGAGTNSWTMIRGMGGSAAATHLISAAVTTVSGGPIDFLTGVAFTDVTAGDTVDIVSSLSTATLTEAKVIISVSGRDVPGNLVTGKTGTLNGTTVVTGIGSGQTFDRLLTVGLGAGTTLTSNPLTSAATSMTVASAANFPASGSYNVLMGREVVTVTAGAGTTTWTITRGAQSTTATAHQLGDSIYCMPTGDIAVFDHTAVISAHTMQSGSAQSTGTTPALAKLQAGDGVTAALNQIIRTTGGTGPNQIRVITAVSPAYGTDFVAVHRDWDTLPDATTTYNVSNGWVLPSKLGSGVGSTVGIQLTNLQRALWGAIADVPGGSTRTFYEKVFVVNDNTATDFTSANVQISSDTPALPGTSTIDLAMCKATNDTFAAANRQTLPTNGDASALTFVVQPSAISVIAGVGALVHGAAFNKTNAQGLWLRTTLPAGTAAYKGAANLRTQGNTI